MVHSFTAMSGVSQETPTTPEADVSQSPRERDPLEGLLYDPVCAAGSVLGRGLEGEVLVPKVPGARGKDTGAIPKRPTEKKPVEVATEATTTRRHGRKPRVFLEERDIVFRQDRAVQTVLGGLNVSDLPKEAGAPVSRSVWDATWRPPVTIIRDTAMNRFRMREAELREEMRRQFEEARAYINWEQQFMSPAAIDRQEVEVYQRVVVMGSVHSLTACPIELPEDDCYSASMELPAPSVASTSLSSKVDRCWNCHSEGPNSVYPMPPT